MHGSTLLLPFCAFEHLRRNAYVVMAKQPVWFIGQGIACMLQKYFIGVLKTVEEISES